MSDEQREVAKEKVVEQCTQAGVTTIHTLEGRQLENDPDVEHLLKVQDSLPFDTLIYYQTTNVDEAVKKGLTRIGGCILCYWMEILARGGQQRCVNRTIMIQPIMGNCIYR